MAVLLLKCCSVWYSAVRMIVSSTFSLKLESQSLLSNDYRCSLPCDKATEAWRRRHTSCAAELAFVALCRTGTGSNRTRYFCAQYKIDFWTLVISITKLKTQLHHIKDLHTSMSDTGRKAQPAFPGLADRWTPPKGRTPPGSLTSYLPINIPFAYLKLFGVCY